MPNWSFNRMTVISHDESDKAEVKRLREFIRRVDKDKDGKEFETPFSFQNVIPMPAELKDTVSPTSNPNSKEAKALRAKYGFDNWYDWRWEHWGTKWDACDVAYGLDDDPGNLYVEFNTAWSFPTPIAVELSKRFPTLTFTYDATEESGLYDMVVEFRNGQVVYYAEWECDDPDDPDSERREIPRLPEEFWK